MEARHDLYVGQDVVCIDNGQPKDTTLPSELTVGQVYKIRWLGVYVHYLDGEYIGVRVEGIDRGTCKIWGDVDQPFKASRFRPLVRDPLAIFRQIAAEPDFKIDGPEGPVRGLPDDGGVENEREREEV